MQRHYVTVGGSRQVHYRRTGSGPTVVILHESPLSSRAYIPLAKELAASFTVLALDTPGFGASDPLAVELPEIADFTDALIETLDALGLESAAFYGAHTGACIALDLADRYPERATALVLDGLPRFSDEERAHLLAHYTPRLETRWDGTHLLAAFNQRRDMKLFFPWFDRREQTRQAITVPSAEQLHEEALDLIKAKDHYWKGYEAAFRYEVEGPISRVEVPTVVAARGDEILGAPQFDDVSLEVRTELLPSDRIRWAVALHALYLDLPSGEQPPAAPETAPLAAPGALTRRYLRLTNGELFLRSWQGPAAGGAERPLVIIHQSPFSGALLEPLARELSRTRAVLLPDSPGYGDSERLGVRDPAISDYAETLLEALRGIGDFDVFGMLTGSAIAAEMALRSGGRVRSLVLDTVPLFEAGFRKELYDHMTPEMPEPTGDGSLLVWAWGLARDHAMWFPHYRQDPEHARPGPPPSADHVHLRTVELLKTGKTFRCGPRAAFAYEYEKRLPRIVTRTLVCSHPGATAYPHMADVHALVPGSEAWLHDGTFAGQAALVARFLDAG